MVRIEFKCMVEIVCGVVCGNWEGVLDGRSVETVVNATMAVVGEFTLV